MCYNVSSYCLVLIHLSGSFIQDLWALESLITLKVISESVLSDLERIAVCLPRFQITGVWQEEAAFPQEQVAKWFKAWFLNSVLTNWKSFIGGFVIYIAFVPMVHWMDGVEHFNREAWRANVNPSR